MNIIDVHLTKPRETIHVTFPDGRTFEGPIGTQVCTFLNIAYPQPAVPHITALVDGELRELTYALEKDSALVPLDLSHSDGVRIYKRSLAFLMIVASRQIFPNIEIFVDHSLPFGGYFCEVRNRAPLSEVELQSLAAQMQQMVDANLPILREEVCLEKALAIFESRNETDKVAIFQGRDRQKKSYLRLYTLNDYRGYFHGYMVPSTGYLHYFRLLRWEDGFILQFPRRSHPTTLLEPQQDAQLLTIFREYGNWLRLLGVECVGDLNQAIAQDRLRKIVLVSEALHEHRIANIAHQIWTRREKVRVVLIAGPSSSGKTTFSKRLAVQLLAHELRPFALEMDNYFVNREDTPRDANGDYDFETLEAVDVVLFNQHLEALMRGEEVQLPKFNFYLGQREAGAVVRLSPDQIVIVEGIHGLNPRLVYSLPEQAMFRIFVSALTQLNLDRHNRVPTTDTRLIRRIVRDARTRGYTAMDTLGRWDSVRRGEKRHIFPYQENADVMFNSALVYEVAMLKPFAEPLLLQVEPRTRQWVEAKRLLTFLQWFRIADANLAPENSILREFTGNLALEDFHWD